MQRADATAGVAARRRGYKKKAAGFPAAFRIQKRWRQAIERITG